MQKKFSFTANGSEDQSAVAADCLVLFDSKSSSHKGSPNTVIDTLSSMKVPYSEKIIYQSSPIDFSEYKTIIISFVQLSLLEDQIDELLNWVEDGGKLLFAIRPDNSKTLS